MRISFLKSNDPGTFTHVQVLAYLDKVQDLLDAYFGDDVPPLQEKSTKEKDLVPEPKRDTTFKFGTAAVILTSFPIAYEASEEFKQAKKDLVSYVQGCFPNLEIMGVVCDKNSLEDMYCIEAIGGDKTKFSYLPPSFQQALIKEKKRQNDLFLNHDGSPT